MNKQSVPFGSAMGIEVAFSKGVAVDITDTKRMVWIAGTVAHDENGEVVGKGDMAAQTEQIIKNMKEVLGEMGGTLDDIVTVTCYVKSMEGLKEHHQVRLKHFKKPYPASTLIQISEFATPDLLLEINATAVVDLNS
jgi:enamine deaminase RidA (YjgF/YER057c/UK114 family)